MATGGNSDFSSDQLNEIKSACCSLCSEDGHNSKARHYCVDCALYFCSKCVQCHKLIPTLRSHQLNEVDAPSWTTDGETREDGEPVSKTVTKCSIHEDKPIDTYCKDHDEICCGTCAIVKHRSCQTTPISVAAKHFNSNPELNECRGMLNNALIQFKQEKEKRTKNIETIGKQKIELLDTIDKYEEMIIEKIQKLANNSRNEVRSKYEKDKEALDKDIEAMNAAITTTTAYVDKLEQTDDEVLFVNVKTSKMVIKDVEILVKDVVKDFCERELKLFLNKTLETTVGGMESLGHLEDDVVNKGYKSTFQKNANLLGISQTTVFDMCFIGTGDLLLADFYGLSLKRFNSELQYKDEIKLPGLPVALCTTEHHELAVRIWCTGEVHIVSLGQTMQFKSKFTLYGNGYGMTYDAGEILACEENKVNVYSTTGKHLRTYDKDANGEKMFSACLQIALSVNKDIYVTNNTTGLTVLDKTGRLKMKVNSFENNNICALCLLPDHVCLVFTQSSGAVYQIDKDGKLLEKQNFTNNLPTPTYCAAFDHGNSRLIIAGNSNVVSIYTVQPYNM